MNIAQDDRFNNAPMLSRGLSMQERLHQSHCADMGNLVRGHSYGGDLQKFNSMTRLRMGTKDIGNPVTPERTGSNLRGVGDLPLSNRLSQQHFRHRSRYGADQNLIPFNSDASLHRWKMETYLSEAPLDASYDALSPVVSPYSSQKGLNEHQSQLIHSRSRDIKARLEETRQKRLSLQDYSNLRQSHESLRSAYLMERPTFMSSLRGLDKSVAESEPKTQNGYSWEPANHRDSEPNKEGILTASHRSASQYDVKTVLDRKTTQTCDWNGPLSRTTSAGDLDMKLKDPSLKHSLLQLSGHNIQQARAMESLIEIPEEKEGSNTRVNSSDSVAFKDGNEFYKDKRGGPVENSVKSSLHAESQHQDQATGSHGSVGRVANSSSSATAGERLKSTSNEVPTNPVEAKSENMDIGQTQCEEPTLQRKNSMRMKVYSLLTSDEKKASKKDEKSPPKKGSVRSGFFSDHSQASVADQTTKKGQSAETEKQKSPFPRLSAQRSSKRKTAEQERGSGSTLNEEAPAGYQRQKVYSRYEYLLNTDNIPKDRGSSLNRPDSGSSSYQTQSGTDNKLGRFMQRVGNLIGKNK